MPARDLVDLMRCVPFPVTIVTASAGEEMRGVTIGSFTTLSMAPPLISFNLSIDSRMHALMEKAEAFVVHIPGAQQAELCRRFALPDLEGDEQFEQIPFRRANGSPPVLDGVIAEIHCRLHQRVVAGDHSIIIGEVERVEQHRREPGLLYLDGSYRKF